MARLTVRTTEEDGVRGRTEHEAMLDLQGSQLIIQLGIDELGMRFSTFRTSAPVFDLSHREDISYVAARLSTIPRDS